MNWIKQNWRKVGLGILVLGVLLFIFIKISDTDTSSEIIPRTNNELCKEGAFAAPLEQEMAYDSDIRKDKFVQHLRKALDGSTSGDSFDSTDYSDYIKSKFIVLSTDIAPGGGESIVLLFKDKPDKVFYAWVYGYRDEDDDDIRGFNLRALNEYDLAKNEAPSIGETQKIFINQLCDDRFGI